MNLLYFLFLTFTTQSTSTESQLDYFIEQDTNNDGFLTKSQFIKALTTLFQNEDIESTKSTCNNYGREFLGKKKVKGHINIQDIRQWIESKELETSFHSWKPSEPNTQAPPFNTPAPTPPISPSAPSKTIQKPLKNNFPDF